MNNVNLIGRLTKDPEVKYTTSDNPMAVARFSIAIDRYEKGGEKKTDYPNIVCFGKTAENCERFLHKGSQVGIHGSIQTGSYTNKDGVKVYTTEVKAFNVEFLGKKEDGESQQGWATQVNATSGFSVAEDDIPF